MSTKILQYIGGRPELRGMTALVRREPKSVRTVLVQFDRVRTANGRDLKHTLCGGWHEFPAREFQSRPTLSQSHTRKVLRQLMQGVGEPLVALPGEIDHLVESDDSPIPYK